MAQYDRQYLFDGLIDQTLAGYRTPLDTLQMLTTEIGNLGDIAPWLIDVMNVVDPTLLNYTLMDLYFATTYQYSTIDIHRFLDDLMNFNLSNDDAAAALAAEYFSAYRGQVVLRTNWGEGAMSTGIMFVGRRVTDPDIIRHEHGHFLQLKELGALAYMYGIGVPSFNQELTMGAGWELFLHLFDPWNNPELWSILFLGKHSFPDIYHSRPWEALADIMGGVVDREHHELVLLLSKLYYEFIQIPEVLEALMAANEGALQAAFENLFGNRGVTR